MIKAIFFDLDDTLYLEGDFFRSGFSEVASVLELRGIGEATTIKRLLESIHFSEGRERVFNKAAVRLGFPESWVPELVEIFRSHMPLISLFADVKTALTRYRQKWLLGCITDGFADVQRRKIKALGVSLLLDTIVVADELGRAYWKPHPKPFQAACDKLGVKAREAIFVGDNFERDIVGAQNVGMTSVIVRRKGAYFYEDAVLSKNQANFEICELCELETVLDIIEGRQS